MAWLNVSHEIFEMLAVNRPIQRVYTRGGFIFKKADLEPSLGQTWANSNKM